MVIFLIMMVMIGSGLAYLLWVEGKRKERMKNRLGYSIQRVKSGRHKLGMDD